MTALCLAHGPGEARSGVEPRPPLKELPSLRVSSPFPPEPKLGSQTPGSRHDGSPQLPARAGREGFLERDWAWP